MTKRYNKAVAAAILDDVRDGKLLSTACDAQNMQRKDFYAWLRDKEARLDGKPFSEAFAEADEDRRSTWREIALQLVNNLHDNASSSEVAVVRAKAQMFMNMAKESALDVFTRTVHQAEDGETVVVIRKFMPIDVPEDTE